jgi:hypothetical protein
MPPIPGPNRTIHAACALLVMMCRATSLAAQPADTCDTAAHRQFDFWIGSWIVTDSTGAVLGTNEIRPVSNGCGLLEQWQGARGVAGVSINFFDAATGRWNQAWVGGGGVILRLVGGLTDGVMELTGTTSRATPNGAVRDRIRWRATDDGTVEQVWLVSRDDGRTWSEIFKGTYRRSAAPAGRRT